MGYSLGTHWVGRYKSAHKYIFRLLCPVPKQIFRAGPLKLTLKPKFSAGQSPATNFCVFGGCDPAFPHATVVRTLFSGTWQMLTVSKCSHVSHSPLRYTLRYVLSAHSCFAKFSQRTGRRAAARREFLIKMSGRCDPDFPAASAALFRFSLSVRKIY